MAKPFKIIILADRGRLLAYEVDRNVQHAMPHLIESLEFTEGRKPMRELVTDKMGGFPSGGTAGQGNSQAERMTVLEEYDSRAMRQISDRMNRILDHYRPGLWAFAAPAAINCGILEHVQRNWHERLGENLTLDLTGVPADEVLEHFDG